ncbi:MAG: hypothetical protein AMJ79_07425 [Phycisphaerae bacterium SM23_30]|nr:MAG: hypothetical protein AMJ79_07425 [Phycisphaerae bacterium SM23_30]
MNKIKFQIVMLLVVAALLLAAVVSAASRQDVVSKLESKIKGQLAEETWDYAGKTFLRVLWEDYKKAHLNPEEDVPGSGHSISGKKPQAESFDQYIGIYNRSADLDASFIEVTKSPQDRFFVALEGHNIPAVAHNKCIFFITGDVVYSTLPRLAEKPYCQLEMFMLIFTDGKYYLGSPMSSVDGWIELVKKTEEAAVAFDQQQWGEGLSDIPPQMMKLLHKQKLVDQAWSADVRADGKKIVYIKLHQSLLNEVSQVWTMNPDGSDQRQLTFDKSLKQHVIFSPDGNHILYVQDDGGLYLLEAQGGDPMLLSPTLKGAGRPAWSKDGKWIVFKKAGENGICLYDYENQTHRELILEEIPAGEYPLRFSWAGDHQRFFFLWREQLYCGDVLTATPEVIKKTIRYALSPDGKYLACGMEGEDRRYELLDANTLQTRSLYQPQEPFYSSAPWMWSPDSSRIIYGSYLWDINRQGPISLGYHPGAFSPPGQITEGYWFDQDRIIYNVYQLSANASRRPGNKDRSIYIHFLDGNRKFTRREKVEEEIPLCVTKLAQALQPQEAAKLLQTTESLSASTRIICTQVMDNIYEAMAQLAYRKYPDRLRHAYQDPSRWDYSDPLADGTNSGFLRRLKNLKPLYGDFDNSNSFVCFSHPGTLNETEYLFGYPLAPIKTILPDRPGYTLGYNSRKQRVLFRLEINDDQTLGADIARLLQHELELFFALEFLYDADDVYGFDITESLQKVITENRKYTSRKIADLKARSGHINLSSTGWPKYNRDVINSGASPSNLQLPLQTKWRKSLPGESGFLAPAVDDKYLYIPMSRPFEGIGLYVLNRKTADVVQEIVTEQGITSSLVLSDDHIFYIQGENLLVAMNKGTWDTAWETVIINGYREVNLTLTDGILFCLGSSYLTALDAGDGTKLWKEMVSGVSGHAVLCDNKIIYAHYKQLIARNQDTGEKIWDYTVEQDFQLRGSPTMTSNRVLAFFIHDSYRGGYLIGIDPDNSEVLWRYQTETIWSTSPACFNDTIILGDNRLYALDTATGDKHWEFPHQNSRLDSPTIFIDIWNSPIIVGRNAICADVNVTVIDLADGSLVQQLVNVINEQLLTGPIFYDGFLYVLDSKGTIYAFN